jgi:hypothetical protein
MDGTGELALSALASHAFQAGCQPPTHVLSNLQQNGCARQISDCISFGKITKQARWARYA